MMKKTAQFISIVLHPFILFDIGIFFFVGENFHWNSQKLFMWGMVILVVNILLILFIKWGMRTKHFSNFDVSKRRQRFLLYQVVIFLAAIFYLVGRFVGVSDTMLQFSLLFLIFIIILEIINTKIKASVHIASITILSLAALEYYRGIFVLLLILIPLLGWSRVYTKRHTVKEVIAGFLIGMLIVIAANVIVK